MFLIGCRTKEDFIQYNISYAGAFVISSAPKLLEVVDLLFWLTRTDFIKKYIYVISDMEFVVGDSQIFRLHKADIRLFETLVATGDKV